jgi:hypothetical protein
MYKGNYLCKITVISLLKTNLNHSILSVKSFNIFSLSMFLYTFLSYFNFKYLSFNQPKAISLTMGGGSSSDDKPIEAENKNEAFSLKQNMMNAKNSPKNSPRNSPRNK